MAKNTPKYTEQEVYVALKQSEGFCYKAARLLDCHVKTVEVYVRRYPKLKDLVTQRKGERVDTIEGVLYEKALAGDTASIIFFLKTQAKDRGYTERYEFKEIRDMSDADLIAAIKSRVGVDPSAIIGSGEKTPLPRSPTVH